MGWSKLDGLVKRQLIRELAHGEMKQSELAEKYDVDPSSITLFKKRNRVEIEAVRKDMDDEFAGLLITQKAMRLSAYEQIFARAMTEVTKIAANGRIAYDENGNAIKEFSGDLAAKVLKQAAEEMGQLPNRVSLSGNVDVHTTYTVQGVDPEELA